MDVPSPEPRVAVEYATIDPALLPPMTPATREAIDRLRSGQRSLADDATAMRAEIARLESLNRDRFDVLTAQIGVLSRRTRRMRVALVVAVVAAIAALIGALA